MWKLMGGLLALPVLLVLSVLMIFWGSGDYVRTVQLNWELELPASEGCLYETDSGASFGGDGERYHVLAYADDSGLEEALEREAERIDPAEEAVTAILDGRLAVSLIPHLGCGRNRDRPAVLPETICRTRGRADHAGSRTGGKRHRHGDAPCRRPGI